jgi:hypothetical protein
MAPAAVGIAPEPSVLDTVFDNAAEHEEYCLMRVALRSADRLAAALARLGRAFMGRDAADLPDCT